MSKHFSKPSDPVMRATHRRWKGLLIAEGKTSWAMGDGGYRSCSKYCGYRTVSSFTMWRVHVNAECPPWDVKGAEPCRLTEWAVCSWYLRSNIPLRAVEADDFTETVKGATANSWLVGMWSILQTGQNMNSYCSCGIQTTLHQNQFAFLFSCHCQ